MTAEMDTPSVACRLGHRIGAGTAGALDVNAACSGFVYALTIAHDLIRAGSISRVAVVGADTITRAMNYSNAGRNTAILFGDAAGAVILEASDNPAQGMLSQALHADGGGWCDIFIPRSERDFPSGVTPDPAKHGFVQMNGSAIFKFAVGTFPRLIEETLAKASLTPADIDLYICHQSNARILTAARERFGIPEERVYVNIDRVGNTVGASVPVCLDEVAKAGRLRPGMRVMFLAFGAGVTWASSLWKL
jgi:3-oxoacyl-[acyl-carrier-protein] synthase-3